MLATRSTAEELMDDPSLPAADYSAVMADLARVNRVTMAHRPTLGFLARHIGSAKRFRLLDVGYGEGDMLRTIAKWAQKRGIDAELVGIDLNASSALAARSATPSSLNIAFLTGDYATLSGGQFDFIISSLVAHHMTHDQLISFLQYMSAEAQRGWFINDLHRHGFAYLGYPLLARLFGWHNIVRRDGQLSIARSYRPAEWPPILAQASVTNARVFRQFPFRLCVESRP